MESAYLLNPSDDRDIACLHHTVGELLRTTIQDFKNGWNEHPISTAENFSPRQLFVLGLLRMKSSGNTFPELNQVNLVLLLWYNPF